MSQLLQLTSDDDCKQCIAMDLIIEIHDVQQQEMVYKGLISSFDDEFFYVPDGRRYSRDQRVLAAFKSPSWDEE
jgi:hypothetical protein